VLTDVVLPDTNGVELVAEFSKIRPGVKALFMSGYSEKAGKVEAHFIQKPFSPETLAGKVRWVLQS